MPIVDIQRRFRELGRIRMGVQVTTRGKTHPKRLARFRITTPWRPLAEGVAEAYGGKVEAWEHPQTGDQWAVLVETDEVDVLVPPGDFLSQFYELWSGGGIKKQCDGLRQIRKDAACSCPSDLGERSELAAKNPPEACQPTTRLGVMLPDVEDFGIWTLSSRGKNAAAELAGAAAICEIATRRGMAVPAVLRLQERVVKRDGQTRRFVVPSLGFRGTPGQVMEALGMTRGPLPVLEAMEPKPALDTGGRAELPPSPAGFGEATDSPETPPSTEEATTPAADLPEPDAFVPPEPESPREEKANLTLGQMLAMRAKEVAGLDDEKRHALYAVVTEGRTESSKELTGLDANEVQAAIVHLGRGEWRLVQNRDGVWGIIDNKTQQVWRRSDGVKPQDAPQAAQDGASQASPTPSAPVVPEVVEEASDGGATPLQPPDEAAWRQLLRERQLRVPDVIKIAARLRGSGRVPGTLKELAANVELAAAVYQELIK